MLSVDDPYVSRIFNLIENFHGALTMPELLILLGQITVWAKAAHPERVIGEITGPAMDRSYLDATKIDELLHPLPRKTAAEHAFLDERAIPYERIEAGKWRMLLADFSQAVWARPEELADALTRWWVVSAGRKEWLAPPAEIASLMLHLTSLQRDEGVYCIGKGSESVAIECMRRGHLPHVISAEPPHLAFLVALLIDKPIEYCRHDPLSVEAAEYFERMGRKPVVAVPAFGRKITDFEAQRWRRSAFQLRTSESLAVECIDANIATRAVVLVPNGVLNRTGPEQNLRAHLTESGHLQSVIAFPSGLLGSSAIPFSLIGLDTTRRTETVLFFEVDNDRHVETTAGLLKQHSRRFIGENEIFLAIANASHTSSRRVACADIRRNDYTWNANRYLAVEDVHHESHHGSDRSLVPFEQIATIVKPQTLRSGEPGKGVKVAEVGPGELPPHGFLTHGARERLIHPLDRERFEQQRLKAGDVLLSTKGTIGRTGIARPDPHRDDISPSQSLIVLRLSGPSPIHDPVVLMMFLRSPYFQARLRSLVVGTTIPNVALTDLRRLPVLIPTLDEQLELRRTFDEQHERQRKIETLLDEQRLAEESIWKTTRLVHEPPRHAHD